MRPMKFLIPTGLAIAATAAVATAAIPGADGSLQGCYMTSGSLKGLLRVVDSSAECKSTETAVSWSQRGPKGEPGAAGSGGALESLTLGGEPLSDGRVDAYLTVPGVTGPSTDPGHAGDIELQSFSFSMRSSTAPGGSGTVGSSSAESVRVTKLADQSSPALMRALTRGTRFPKVTVSFREPGARFDAQRYELSDVVISQFAQGGKPEPELLEQIDLRFTSVLSAFTPTRPDGGQGAEASFSFDFVRQQ